MNSNRNINYCTRCGLERSRWNNWTDGPCPRCQVFYGTPKETEPVGEVYNENLLSEIRKLNQRIDQLEDRLNQ